jgi:RNA polymerase sigma factor (sigma-70 family)
VLATSDAADRRKYREQTDLAETVSADVTISCRHRGGFEGERTGELVRRATSGDELAWAALINRFGPMVVRVAHRTGLNAADAADAHQATWVQLMRRLDQVRDPERIGGWLVTTARRQSQRIAIARGRHTLTSDLVTESLESHSLSAEALVLRSHYEPQVEQALGRLPTAYQQLLVTLTSNPVPSYEEVAKSLGLPVGSIGPMRLRALQMLRRDSELRRFHSNSGDPGVL